MGILEKMRLDGKTVYVTGGSSGIGKSAAYGFAEAGADVAIVGTNLKKAQQVAKEIAEATGSHTIAIACDVTCPEQVENMVAKMVETYGKIDAGFNNAGIPQCVNAEEISYEEWLKIINVNLNGVFLCATAAGRQMLKQGYGSLINTASISGHIVNIPNFQCAYNTSKAGVIMLTKSLAVEWARRGVRVNSVSPGYITTDLIEKNPDFQPLIQQWKTYVPVGNLGRPEHLQSILVYLAGDTCPYTTGADFLIDGGYTAF